MGLDQVRYVAEKFAGLSDDKRRLVYQQLRAQGLSPGQFPILPRGSQARGECVASAAQARQWFLWELDPRSTAYHLAGVMRLEGQFDIEAARAALSGVVQRHESLRTVFRMGEQGQLQQLIREQAEIDFSCLDLGASGQAHAQQAEVQRICSQPFDLARGPLLRAVVLRLAPEAHLFVVVMHHIVADGWSLQIVVNEFAQRYRALVRGEAVALAPLAVQYADHALWQRSWLDAGEADRQLLYWQQQLGDKHPGLELPADWQRRSDGRYQAARHGLVLSVDLVQRLRALADRHGASLFMVLLAGFQALLHRHTGCEDIRVGVPIANRHRVETEGLVGFFVNTQVLRARLHGSMPFRQLLNQTRKAALEAQDHQDLPFERLVEALQPERSLGSSPLFQVMFNHLREDYRALQQLPSLKAELCDTGDKAAQFEWMLETTERPDGSVHARFSYARERFEPSRIARLADHWVHMLSVFADRPDCWMGSVDLLPAAETTQLHALARATHVQGDIQPLHQRMQHWARRCPGVPALAFGQQSLTYAELDARANRLAHRLIALGVRPETRVGIAMQRSVEMVVGLLAILKAGGAYVPLDPDYPADRLAHMVQDSGIALVLTHSSVRERIPGAAALQVLEIDTLDLSGEPGTDPQVEVSPDSLAYVIYTSGSTGRPKGAQLSHRNVARLLDATDAWFGFGPDDVWTLFHSYAFDFSVWEIFGALCTGGRLVVVPYWVSRSPQDFLALLRAERVTVLNQTPSAFGQLVHAVEQDEEGGSGLSLRQVVFGGEALEPESLRPWFDRFGDQGPRLINMYGITETTVHVTYREITKTDLQGGRSPVGVAIPDLGLYVLDGSLNLLPQGVAGELFVAGEGLARGYLNRAGLSAERFIANPFVETGERLYRTGDLVRWNAQGELEYLGRADQQVKIRGFRIELGEVQSQLLAQPEVREAAVLAKEGPGGARLVAYVSLNEDLEEGMLRGRLGQVLPDYMVPSVIVVLDALPLTANGKVDRRALPEPEMASAQEYEAPQGELEEMLASIWAEVLGVERVGRQDGFFELGGHSLLALGLLERVRAQGLCVQVRTLFQHPRLAEFAQAVEQGQGQTNGEIDVPPNLIPEGCAEITPQMLTLVELDAREIARITAGVPGGAANIQDIYPLAPLQEGMLFHHMLDTQHDAYVTSHELLFDSRERLEHFAASFNTVIARHDILRTAVLWEGLREPVQVVWRQAVLQLRWLEGVHALPQAHRIDVRQAPMIDGFAAPDGQRWRLRLYTHHMVDDNTTLKLAVREIGLVQQGLQAQLPEPVAFRRFVAQARLGGSRAGHEAFFRQMLADVQEPTAPYGLLDVRGDGSEVQEARLELDAGLARRIREQARSHGVSAAALFHLAWALVVGRTTGREDVVFGTVLFGRMQGQRDAGRALGMFINTLPIRIRLGVQGVVQALRQAHVALTRLLEHEHASLSLAQRCSGLEAGVPLFTALLNYRHGASASDDTAKSWEGMEILGTRERTNYPFGLYVNDRDGGFELVAHIAQQVGAQRVADAVRQTLESLVQALAARPSMAAVDMAVLDGRELASLRQRGTFLKAGQHAQPLHRLVAQQAGSHPGAIALRCGAHTLTYAELDARANRLAHRLIALGVRPETRVGIAMQRSVEMVVGLLAILKAGGAYVPLDPDYPADRLAHMVQDSGIALVLTHSSVRERIPGAAALQVLEIDTLDLSGEPGTDPQVEVSPDSLAYVIYTSGSTGRPKGAQLSHRNVARLLDATDAWFGFGPGDTWTLFHSYAFDFSVWEIFGALCTGGRLVVVPYWVSRSPQDFLALLRAERVTVLNQTPSAFGQLVHAVEQDEEGGSGLSLRQVVFGGEALEPESLRPWFDRFGDQGPRLINMYGITETTVHVTYREITKTDLQGGRSPVGVAIPDLGLYVLDGSLNLLPQGVAGELFVAGEGLARGYLNRAGLSAERFIANPFVETGERLYRTGDLVRWNAQGELEYLGRADQQVKIRGFRIELGEVQSQLLAQPEVREAAVLARQGPGGSRLVAYVSLHSAVEDSVLRQRLGQVLPDYMVPSAIVVLDALPLTANGKVDRRALPEPEMASAQEYEAPQGELEETLAKIWAEVLGVERVGRQDGFFELGGDSILALKLVERARKAALRLLPRQVFEQQSLAAMARVAQPACEGGDGVPAIPRLAPALHAQPLQPSYAQLRQWFLWQLDPTSSAYHIAGALRLFGALEMDAVCTCFTQLLQRHEALRTVFPLSSSGQPQQVVLEHMALDIALQDLQGPNAQARLDETIRHVSATPFDLAQGPLLRVAVLRLAEAEHVLVVAMHHIVSDGWSLDVIIREFVALYRAHVLGLPCSLPELPVRYADYAAWQRSWMNSAEKVRQLAYWTQQLGDEHPILELPLDHARQVGAQYRLENHGLELEPALAQRLKTVAHQRGATLFMLLLAGLQVQLSRYGGQSDIRVGVPIANRHRRGTGSTVGMFVNTQVLRSHIDGHASLEQIIAQVRQAVLEAQSHQDLPFDQLVEALQPERNMGINPLFQVMHNHQRVDTRPLEQLPGLSLQEMRIGGRTAQLELTLNTTECADGRILVNWAYAGELFDAQTIKRMAGHYLVILQAMAQRPQQAVRGLELVDATERTSLHEWGVNDQGAPYAEPVHRIFEQRVRENPGATALVFEKQALSYAELNARANRLAHRLIALGVGPEARVGVAAHRSVEMVVALLAVLKAGGAYVPLDPEYPDDRLAWIAEDSRMQLLLTQGNLGKCIPGTERLHRLELDLLDLDSGPDQDPAVPVHGENLAYVIYTSGSTGRPKGAANRHSSLASCMRWMQRTYVISGADAVLHKAPFGFDVSVWEIFWPLTAGSRLVVSRPGDHRDPERIIALILQHGITTLNFVPSMLQAFLAHEGIDERARLRHVICGGEAMPADTQREALRRLPGVSLQNLYGPTETTIHVTRWTCRDEGDAIVPNVPIGRPIDGVRTYVLDADLNLVAPGVAGELYLGGGGLGRGYVNRAGLTSERFVANPVDGGGTLLYRTGDLVRWNPEAQIEYLGRIDHQVKIRGLRIELGEIEARLLAQPEVREAVVVACEGPNGPLLAGYVAMRKAVEPVDLRQRLARDLPDYMVPTGIVVLEALPLNANGKVDRKALPAFVPASAAGYEPPQGETEALLASLWSELLGVPRVGRNDHFFELGGNSMAVIRLQLRVHQACGASVGLRTYFEKPVLGHLAAHIDDYIRGSQAGKAADLDLIGSILDKVEG